MGKNQKKSLSTIKLLRFFVRNKKTTQVLTVLYCILSVIVIVTGCKAEKTLDGGKIQDIQFEIVEADKAPKEVLNMIEPQKENPFRFSYTNGEDMYIVIGYGEKSTGGYSIQVKELYLTNKEIVIETELIGPSKEDVVTMALSYPYIIIKIKYIDKPVYYL